MRGSDDSAMSASRGAVRRPLPSRSALIVAVIETSPCAGSIASRLTADIPYPTTATHFGWLPRSPAYPPRIRTSALTPWYIPSTKPYARRPSPTCVVRYSGSTAETISEETSVSRLTVPSRTTVVATPAAVVVTSPAAGRSRNETYTYGPPPRGRGAATGSSIEPAGRRRESPVVPNSRHRRPTAMRPNRRLGGRSGEEAEAT